MLTSYMKTFRLKSHPVIHTGQKVGDSLSSLQTERGGGGMSVSKDDGLQGQGYFKAAVSPQRLQRHRNEEVQSTRAGKWAHEFDF